MVSKDETWSSGVDTNFSTSLNNSIMQPLSNFDETDDDFAAVSSSTYVDKYTLSVDAGAISNYVLISFTIWAAGQAGTSYTSVTTHGKVQIDGGDVSFERSLDAGASELYAYKALNTYFYKYVPSAGEKSSGFTITVQGKYTKGGTGGTGGSSYLGGFRVWGA